jgi:hypothetical protein
VKDLKQYFDVGVGRDPVNIILYLRAWRSPQERAVKQGAFSTGFNFEELELNPVHLFGINDILVIHKFSSTEYFMWQGVYPFLIGGFIV